jgi:replicative DNA helicase
MERWLGAMANVNTRHIRYNRFVNEPDNDEAGRIFMAQRYMAQQEQRGHYLLINDKSGQTVNDFVLWAQRQQHDHPNLKFIAIDYLQLFKMDTGGNLATIVGEVMRNIQDVAKTLGIPILIISQINRGVESRADKRPALSDLRDSGRIEEVADTTMLLYRDSYYNPVPDENQFLPIEIIVAKNRHGGLGTAEFYGHLPTQLVSNEPQHQTGNCNAL